MLRVIAADLDSPVDFVNSLPSYSDADDDQLDFAAMPAENAEVSVAASAMQDGREAHQSTSAAQSLSSHDEVAESDASACSPVCAPILVVPSSDSFISLLRTPDSSPTRPPLYSPSQARSLQSFCSDSPSCQSFVYWVFGINNI